MTEARDEQESITKYESWLNSSVSQEKKKQHIKHFLHVCGMCPPKSIPSPCSLF